MANVANYGQCAACRRLFSFNPVSVPWLLVNAKREPVCQSCIDRVNPKRQEYGLEPIVPPPGAYEACDESELEG